MRWCVVSCGLDVLRRSLRVEDGRFVRWGHCLLRMWFVSSVFWQSVHGVGGVE